MEPYGGDRDLFRAGDDGFVEHRIPALVTTPTGAVIAACEGRRVAGSDWGASVIRWRRGETPGGDWSPAGTLTPPVPGSAHNPTLIVDGATGRVHLLFVTDYRRAWQAVSRDDGRTFGPAREITAAFADFQSRYPWKVVAIGPGHGIQLRTGRLLATAWLSDSSGADAHRPSVVLTLASDDEGLTWHCGELVCAHPQPVNPSEAVLVELSSGRVLLNLRNESERWRRMICTSPIGTGDWTEPHDHPDLFCPTCHAALVRLASGALLFINPDPRDNPIRMWGALTIRRRLCAKWSFDEGRTWPVERVLDDGEWAAYCDAVALPDGRALCLYECGGGQARQWVTQSLRLITVERP